MRIPGAKLAMLIGSISKKGRYVARRWGACEPQKCAKGHLVQLRESWHCHRHFFSAKIFLNVIYNRAGREQRRNHWGKGGDQRNLYRSPFGVIRWETAKFQCAKILSMTHPLTTFWLINVIAMGKSKCCTFAKSGISCLSNSHR